MVGGHGHIKGKGFACQARHEEPRTSSWIRVATIGPINTSGAAPCTGSGTLGHLSSW